MEMIESIPNRNKNLLHIINFLLEQNKNLSKRQTVQLTKRGTRTEVSKRRTTAKTLTSQRPVDRQVDSDYCEVSQSGSDELNILKGRYVSLCKYEGH